MRTYSHILPWFGPWVLSGDLFAKITGFQLSDHQPFRTCKKFE